MRLAPFILENIEHILAEWDAFARSLAPGSKTATLALRNEAEAILLAAARDMQVGQSLAQQLDKSQGRGGSGGAASDRLDHASAVHGAERAGLGFDIMAVVSEYRALRASVLRLWRQSAPLPDLNDLDDITRFNESLDQSLAGAIGSYTQRVEQSRRMFLAILSHDLRNPLNCIRMAAHLVAHAGHQSPPSAQALSLIETNTETIARLIRDLIDFASTGAGRAMPLTRGPVDLETLCREVIATYRSMHPARLLHFHVQGELTGDWDAARLRQVVSNLIGNALQHGAPQGPVELSAVSAGATVEVRVHNEGAPIPPARLATLFDPLRRYDTLESATQRVPGSIGLGLYIVREIVVAHAGTLEVTSTAQDGTTFTVRLPRWHADGNDPRDDA